MLRARVLDSARRLVSQCGPNVTLSEVAHDVRGAGAKRQRPIRTDAIVESLLEQRLGDLVEVVRVAAPLQTSAPIGRWTEAVRDILSDELDRPAISLREAARTLAVSARTLQRRLADEGTSWRGEIDAARKERAARLLQEGTRSDLIAAHVGFSSSRSLRRAVRRWDQTSV